MFVFLTAFKSPTLTNHWSQVQLLGRATIGSLLQQKGIPYKIITIYNEDPFPGEYFNDHIIKVKANFSPPSLHNLNADTGTADKWKKLHLGLLEARELNPDWVMLMDCDDLLHCNLLSFVSEKQNSNGFIINRGYRWRFKSKKMRKDNTYSCGTNAIHNVKLLGLPQDFTNNERLNSPILSLGHTIVENEMIRRGTPMTQIPFHAAINVRDHGENISHDRKFYHPRWALSEMRAWKEWTLVKPKHREEFHMYYD